MVSSEVKIAGRTAGSMIWLILLYGGLLYVAVGSLGVSDLTSRLGGRAANIVHIVSVAKDIREGERARLQLAETQLRQMDASLETAVRDLRDFGIANGLALQDIQPIIDTYALAPKLSDLSKRAVDAATEATWADRMARVMALQLDIKRLQARIDDSHAILRASWSAHPAILEEAKRADLNTVDIDLAASTAEALQRLGYGRMFALPSEILTLLLALSMGALGSTLHITRMLLEGTDQRAPSYYLIRPFQGMVTALVVFVLLKAGQLTISAGDSDNLNIFFVSFSGIASGLLAEEAYRMIKKAGAGIIKTEEENARWAFKLRAALDARGTTAEDLALGLGATPAEVRGWLEETQPVAPLQQRLIATWLHMPERELFTSQPPAETSEPPAEAAPA